MRKNFDNNEFEKIVISCTDSVADRLKKIYKKVMRKNNMICIMTLKRPLVVHFFSFIRFC
jgi:hypothetical protein